MNKPLISICVPVYNEKDNIGSAYRRITDEMRKLAAYDYEIVFFDDGSTDGSVKIIEDICKADDHVKAVIYQRNFGYAKTTFYCMQQAKGDAAVIIHCDLQNPPEEIHRLIEKWEQGADVVLGVKNKSRENRFMYFLRTIGYFILNFVFGMRMVPHATEFELLDKSILQILREIRAQNPYLRGYILEYGRHIEKICYTQDKRRAGKSHFNISKMYDFVIAGIVNESRCLPRRFILFSVAALVLLLIEFAVHFLPGCGEMIGDLFWNGLLIRFGVFVLLLFVLLVSVLFEYVQAILKNAEQKPFIIEDRRINY